MLRTAICTVQGIADWRLCLGCGACSYICPDRKIELIDALDEGIRPIVSDAQCGPCRSCLEVCPALENDHRTLNLRRGIEPSLKEDFGPVLEIWEGYARDEEVRYRGSSGGAITALALYCLERRHAHGVLHLQGDPADPVRNRTWLSRSRDELIAGTGSRYAPGSVCDSLDLIESAHAECVFIGQPCEVTALRKAQRLKPGLAEKVGLAISFFCAGSPSTRGTVEVLRSNGIDPENVAEIRYRGLGWPGMFAVRTRQESTLRPLLNYRDSWGALQRFRPYGVYLFPDMSGEDADISCADAWNRGDDRNGGYSLIVARTERGREVVRAAIENGYLVATRTDARRLLQAQTSLVGKRGVIWGRVLAFRLLGLPAPRLKGFSGAAAWWKLPLKDKLRSTVGTARRILQRGYFRSLRLDRLSGVVRSSRQTQTTDARRGSNRAPEEVRVR